MTHHDHHGNGHAGGVHSHISSTGTYVTIFFLLIVCTVLTYLVSTWDLGHYHFAAAIGIALFKASLVVLYFMHVKWSHVLTKMAVITSLAFLLILLLLTSTDYSSRSWLPKQEGWEKHQVLD